MNKLEQKIWKMIFVSFLSLRFCSMESSYGAEKKKMPE